MLELDLVLVSQSCLVLSFLLTNKMLFFIFYLDCITEICDYVLNVTLGRVALKIDLA